MDGIERLWTHDETASYLHVSPWTLHHLVGQGEGPPAYRVGRNRRYDPSEVRSWLRGSLPADDTDERPGRDQDASQAQSGASIGTNTAASGSTGARSDGTRNRSGTDAAATSTGGSGRIDDARPDGQRDERRARGQR